MAVLTMIKAIKKIYKHDVLLVKIGDFFHVYGKDAYILSYLMGYKLATIEANCPTCGFPRKSLKKIEATLEEKMVNYLTLDRRDNYEPDEISDNKNLNQYDKIFEKAHLYLTSKKRIDEICGKLMARIGKENFPDVIKQIEEIVG